MPIQIRHEETLTLNYEVAGEGPDVVLVHGLGLSSMKTWVHQVPELSRHFRVHTYDVRGFGRSANPAGKFSVQQHADDLHALLRELGLRQVVLVGFSMGGWISQQFVLDHPEMFRDNPSLIEFYRRNFLDPDENKPRSYAAMFRALSVPNWTPQLGRIRCPALVLCGDADKGITRGNTPTDAAEILHQGIAGSRLEVIPQGGHYAHLERPADWNARVIRFIKEVTQ